MTSTQEQPHVSVSASDREQPTDPASGPIEAVSAETFGRIHPDVAGRPLTRRAGRPRLGSLGLLAAALAVVGLVVSWFGPWGAGFGLVALVIGAVAAIRRTQPAAWCGVAIGLGIASLLCSAYWVVWIMAQLAAPAG